VRSTKLQSSQVDVSFSEETVVRGTTIWSLIWSLVKRSEMTKRLIWLLFAASLTCVAGCGTTGLSSNVVSPFKTVHPSVATGTVGNTTEAFRHTRIDPSRYVERDTVMEAVEATSPIPETTPAIVGPELIDPAVGTNQFELTH
jgi:hypothetical protein